MKKVTTIIALSLTPMIAFAAIDDKEGVLRALENITNLFFSILMAIAVIVILLAAFKFLTAGGNPENAETAKKMILYAVIAIVVALLAKAIPASIQSLIISGGSEVGDHVPAQSTGDGGFVR